MNVFLNHSIVGHTTDHLDRPSHPRYIFPSEKVKGYKQETSLIVFYGLSINQPYLPLSYGTTKTIIVIYEALSFA